jgi:hypothetical protein
MKKEKEAEEYVAREKQTKTDTAFSLLGLLQIKRPKLCFDRPCDLVVRASNYRSRGLSSIPGAN